MTTPCYYCERPEDHCKFCIHSDTYEEPKQTKPLSDEEILELFHHYAENVYPVGRYLTYYNAFARAIEEKHGIS